MVVALSDGNWSIATHVDRGGTCREVSPNRRLRTTTAARQSSAQYATFRRFVSCAEMATKETGTTFVQSVFRTLPRNTVDRETAASFGVSHADIQAALSRAEHLGETLRFSAARFAIPTVDEALVTSRGKSVCGRIAVALFCPAIRTNQERVDAPIPFGSRKNVRWFLCHLETRI